ncbi:hypothetical protein K525DRAFT_274325 [Schizophyllum commune Loenen D]|nr:hypothetical protein K525DRAFT_274325 [Schizophyllum commune Loenen D]
MGRTHSGLFSDNEVFNAWRKAGPADDSLYCNGSAYGRTRGRSWRHHEDCWKEAQKLADFIQHGRPGTSKPYSFYQLTKFIDKLKIPSCGPLISFLLAGDLYYCGAAPAPTFKEISQLSHAGAVRGLGKLGLPHTSNPEAASSMSQLFDAISAELSDKEKSEWGWDALMLEHALCKYTRLPMHPLQD